MFTSTTLDNLKNLPDGYVEELKRMYSKDMQQRMIYGLFGKVHKGRPVYPQFQRGQYVFDVPYDPTLPLIRGWDFGYNRPACVWLQMKKNQIRVLAEMLGKEVYLDDFVKDTVLPYQMSLFGEQRMKILDFCDPRGADCNRGNLRDELRIHARTGKPLWLFHRCRRDADHLHRFVHQVQAAGMAVTRRNTAQ
jgi:hypothetical protein